MSSDNINTVTNNLNEENRQLLASTTIRQISSDFSSTCSDNSSSSDKEHSFCTTSPIGTVSPNAETFHTTNRFEYWPTALHLIFCHFITFF